MQLEDKLAIWRIAPSMMWHVLPAVWTAPGYTASWVQRGGGHLPQLYAGWAVYFAAESAVFQRLLL